MSETAPIRIGTSACLLGQNVRFDGGHKRDAYLVDALGPIATFVPICPEAELGLGVPRETLRLVRVERDVALVGTKSGQDHTESMRAYARERSRQIAELDLSGFVLKKDSPTCGVHRVRVYDSNGVPSRTGTGVFAEELAKACPLLPIEEEGRLRDPHLRENFFERVFAYRRLKLFFASAWTRGGLVAFHSREKTLLLAHDNGAYRELGRLVARSKREERGELAREYGTRFMGALARVATPKRHRNVLEHLAGYFKKTLGRDEKTTLRCHIEDFAHGLVPLVVPITLLRLFIRQHGVEYLAHQTYLEPHPKELALRNHV